MSGYTFGKYVDLSNFLQQTHINSIIFANLSVEGESWLYSVQRILFSQHKCWYQSNYLHSNQSNEWTKYNTPKYLTLASQLTD